MHGFMLPSDRRYIGIGMNANSSNEDSFPQIRLASAVRQLVSVVGSMRRWFDRGQPCHAGESSRFAVTASVSIASSARTSTQPRSCAKPARALGLALMAGDRACRSAELACMASGNGKKHLGCRPGRQHTVQH